MTATKTRRHRDRTHKRAALGKCPHPHKNPYNTEAEAELAISETWQYPRPGGIYPLPLRAYKCVCGKWHMTHQEKETATV